MFPSLIVVRSRSRIRRTSSLSRPVAVATSAIFGPFLSPHASEAFLMACFFLSDTALSSLP